MDGVYKPVQGQLYNGRPLYCKEQKVGEPVRWLRYCLDHTWAVGTTEEKDSTCSSGLAYSLERGVALPQDVSHWQIFVKGKLIQHANIQVTLIFCVSACFTVCRLPFLVSLLACFLFFFIDKKVY